MPPLLLGGCVLYLITNQLVKTVPSLSNPIIGLYLFHFRRGLVALPAMMLLAWGAVRFGLKPFTMLTAVERRMGPLLPVLLLGAAFGFLLLVANFAYHRLPQGDAVGVYFQTKVFALGRLYAPAPAYPEFFSVHAVRAFDNKWFAFYSPGHAILLLPGYLLGLTWLVGPALGALILFIIYRIALESCGPRVARLALLLGAISPFFLFLAASYDFHVGSLFFSTAGLFFASRLTKQPRSAYAVMLGLSIGGTFLCRPYTGLLLGIASFCYLLVTRPRSLPAMVAGTLPLIIVQLFYNRSLVGDYFTMPYQKLPLLHGIGFSPDFGDASFNMAGHTPLKAAINLGYNLFTMSLQLLGWPGLSVFPALLAVLLRRQRFVALLLCWVGALFVGHFFYWFHGVTPYGPKYVAESIPSLLILSAIGLSELRHHLAAHDSMTDGHPRQQILAGIVVLLLAYGMFFHLPSHFRFFSTGRWGETPRLVKAAHDLKIDNAIVFMKERIVHQSFFVTSGFIFNDPRLNSSIIFARDLGASNIKLIETYPNRKLFIVDENDYLIKPYHYAVQ